MTMHFYYDSNGSPLTTEPCTARASSHSVQPILINNFAVAYKRTVTIEAFLYAPPNLTWPANIQNLRAQMQNVEEKLSINYWNGGVRYYDDNNNPQVTQHFLTNNDSIGGVVIEDFQWLDTPTHLATEAKFTVTLSATYPNALELPARNVILYEETLDITGNGGPITPLAPQAGRTSLRQQVQDYSDVTIVQAGRITSRFGYSMLPAPLIPLGGAHQGHLMQDGKRQVQIGNGTLMFERNYQYTFTLPSHPGAINPQILV